MKTKHTPGPWFPNGDNTVILSESDANFITCISRGIDIDICQVFDQYEFDNDVQTALMDLSETEANVRLIAAAPKMLAALIEISEVKGRYDEDKLIHASNTIEDLIQLAKEAINEAVS